MWPPFTLRPFYAFVASHSLATYAMVVAVYFLETPHARVDAQDLLLLALTPLLSWYMVLEAVTRASVHPLHTLYVGATYFPVLALGLFLLVRRRTRSPRSHGKCRKCGYDLRATPDRCPECGEPTAGPPPAPRPKFVR
jgi:hypothetical protein